MAYKSKKELPVGDSPAHQAIAHVDRALDENLFLEKIDPKRVNTLRVSSFPFCATSWFLNLPRSTSQRARVSFEDRFFTGVGTSVHSVAQASLALSKYVVRDWICGECHHRHKFQIRPIKCISCGERYDERLWKYDESSVASRGIINGHIDDAIYVPKARKIVMLDYKTTSTSKIDLKGALPNLGNVRQLEAYAAIQLEAGYDIDLKDGWFLVYVARDNMRRKYIPGSAFYKHSFEKEMPKIVNRLDRYVSDYKQISGATTIKEVYYALTNRRTKLGHEPLDLCEHCKHAPYCSDDKRVKQQAEVVFSKIEHKLPIVKYAASEAAASSSSKIKTKKK